MQITSTPCVAICRIDPATGLCIGCGRTGEEITAWATMSETERLTVMAGLEQRLAIARSRATRRGQLAARRRRS